MTETPSNQAPLTVLIAMFLLHRHRHRPDLASMDEMTGYHSGTFDTWLRTETTASLYVSREEFGALLPEARAIAHRKLAADAEVERQKAERESLFF